MKSLDIPQKIKNPFNVTIDKTDMANVIKIKIRDNFFNLFIIKIIKHHINTDLL